MNPLVSIIVPVHNGQDYLEKCIESIWKQSYEPIEIIIVNDSSTDDTTLVCGKLRKKYRADDNQRRIEVLELASGHGVSNARNAGIEVARGEYISFVDCDDRIMPDMIEVLYKGIKQTKASVSGCGFFMWKNTNELDSFEGQIDKREYTNYTSNAFRQEILSGNTRCWSKLYKQEIFADSINRFDSLFSIGEDMLFLGNLTKQGYDFCETTYQGYAYFQNNDGAMAKKFEPKAMDQIYCWEKARDILGASPKLDSNIIISALITIGRIARLSRKEQAMYAREIDTVTDTFKKYYSRKVNLLLDKGYRFKTILFRMSPKLYLLLYSNWKKG